jgi:hypothetical protein
MTCFMLCLVNDIVFYLVKHFTQWKNSVNSILVMVVSCYKSSLSFSNSLQFSVIKLCRFNYYGKCSYMPFHLLQLVVLYTVLDD